MPWKLARDHNMTGWWSGTMEFHDFPIMLGMESSSQLTFTQIFQRGRSATNQIRKTSNKLDI